MYRLWLSGTFPSVFWLFLLLWWSHDVIVKSSKELPFSDTATEPTTTRSTFTFASKPMGTLKSFTPWEKNVQKTRMFEGLQITIKFRVKMYVKMCKSSKLEPERRNRCVAVLCWLPGGEQFYWKARCEDEESGPAMFSVPAKKISNIRHWHFNCAKAIADP